MVVGAGVRVDPRKDAANLARHGVSFEEAAGVIDRGETIRIVGARRVTRSERRTYAEGLN